MRKVKNIQRRHSMKIKTVSYPTSLDKIPNIYDDNIDVFVETEEGKNYTITVCTPEFYNSYMKKENLDYVPAGCPDIIVSTLKDDVIKKALETYCEYDGYWLERYGSWGT